MTFDVGDALAINDELRSKPLGRYELLLCEPGQTPQRLTRPEADELFAGQSRMRKVLARTWAPAGTALVLAVSDDGVGIRYWPLPEPTPAMCAALAVPR